MLFQASLSPHSPHADMDFFAKPVIRQREVWSAIAVDYGISAAVFFKERFRLILQSI
jgi:hypothetical protein